VILFQLTGEELSGEQTNSKALSVLQISEMSFGWDETNLGDD
jgi:hypothetical protein